jgi:hypothetical protein
MSRQNEKMATIYGLCDPVTKQIKYVGATKDPAARLRSHIVQARRTHLKGRRLLPSQEWINELTDQSLTPLMVILAVVPATEAKKLEEEWIALLQKTTKLCNLSSGGYKKNEERRIAVVYKSSTVMKFEQLQSECDDPSEIYKDRSLMLWFLNRIIDDCEDIEMLNRIAECCYQKVGLPQTYGNLDKLQDVLAKSSIKRKNIQSTESALEVAKQVAHDIAALRRKYAGE